VGDDEEIAVSMLGEEAGRAISRAELCRIIESRMRETFELIGAELQAGGAGMLPAGLILTGGGAQLAGVAELGREVLQMPVRVVGPSGVGGLTDSILTPAYATSIGLLQWGASMLDDGEATRYESAPAAGVLGRLRSAVKSMLP
jgi:cell division protein FtsA